MVWLICTLILRNVLIKGYFRAFLLLLFLSFHFGSEFCLSFFYVDQDGAIQQISHMLKISSMMEL